MAHESLEKLVALSACVGKNLDLVQAGGGNTSIKEAGTLWVKASGKWLSHAADEDMFLPVPMADIERQLSAEDEKFPEYRTRTGVALRPSVETAVHAVIPHRVVIHVHSVRTIAWASRADGREGLTTFLSGLRWNWIPYTHPGIPLALRLRDEMASKPDVWVLENHGLIVAADDCEAAEKLLHEVEHRLDAPTNIAGTPDLARLKKLTEAAADWQIAEDAEAHALATNQKSCQIAANGTLFPDQCVYLGPAAAIMKPSESLAEAAARYQTRFDFEPVCLLVSGAGVVTKRSLKRSARELLLGLKRVIERIPETAQATYLPVSQVGRLMNWDAEKYRIAMAQTES